MAQGPEKYLIEEVIQEISNAIALAQQPDQ
jgi:hypothetical protein